MAGTLQNNWTLIDDWCYLISDTNGTLPDAQYFCALHDGMLFEPRSELEDLGVQAYLNSNRTYWIGIMVRKLAK